MSSVTVFLFRILLVIGGFVLMYIVGKPVVETIQYKISGNSVTGVVIGFRGSRTSKTVFDENTAKYGKKLRARRPVYRYPITSGSLDSLDGFARSTIIIPWLNFDKHEEVKVVVDKNDPTKSHIFSKGIIMTDIVLLLLCLYMVKLGIPRSDS